ncbi:MAG: 3'(2'),5'-bisphosphate nucleotidase CysQ [Sneathiella sp.]|mgnify:CR=1 FL=1|uniref:3'(2'),5'-bisphosphate nucleotidase CysQ n=1 Tax=Sneathiella sp. TaxID=1964365 RepID=UPI000C4EB8A5|nr:3'(2'),5'-bisphosphate nucleotidase CysQ [Sneathiella sp.]MAZ02974.1 3'(2'),5'-bisphosphate nucleotidase CysQ [Sneathiella sp.]
MTQRFAKDHALLTDAMKEAGDIARRYFKSTLKSWEKKPGDPVSEADLALDTHFKEKLLTARPDYGWLSEETADNTDRLNKSRVWIIDPIDGTRSFIAGKPEFTICAALVEDGKPVLGIVYNPILEEYYEAVVGGGAKLNGEAIICSRKADLSDAKLIASRKSFEWHGWLDDVKNATFSHVNSIAYRIVKVASRHADASLSLTQKSDWDIAAADIILSEAGGVTTTTLGERLVYNRKSVNQRNVISCGKSIHPELMKMLETFGTAKSK